MPLIQGLPVRRFLQSTGSFLNHYADAAQTVGVIIALAAVAWQIYADRHENRVDRAFSYCDRFRNDEKLLEATDYTKGIWKRYAADEICVKRDGFSKVCLTSFIIEAHEDAKIAEMIRARYFDEYANAVRLPGGRDVSGPPEYVDTQKFTEIIYYFKSAVDFVNSGAIEPETAKACLGTNMAAFVERYYHRLPLFYDDTNIEQIRSFILRDDAPPEEWYSLATGHEWDIANEEVD